MYCAPDDIRMLTELVQGEEDEYFIPYIKKASVYIDSRLSRYVTPLVNVPLVLVSVCADLAASYIVDQHTTERFKDQTTYGSTLYRRAITMLHEVLESGELDFTLPLRSEQRRSGNVAIRSTTPRKSPLQQAMEKW